MGKQNIIHIEFLAIIKNLDQSVNIQLTQLNSSLPHLLCISYHLCVCGHCLMEYIYILNRN